MCVCVLVCVPVLIAKLSSTWLDNQTTFYSHYKLEPVLHNVGRGMLMVERTCYCLDYGLELVPKLNVS